MDVDVLLYDIDDRVRNGMLLWEGTTANCYNALQGSCKSTVGRTRNG